MQKVDITELRRLHEAAKKGKWVAMTAEYEAEDGIAWAQSADCQRDADHAEYISAAHNSLPALLDELEAARERHEVYADENDRLIEAVRAGLKRRSFHGIAEGVSLLLDELEAAQEEVREESNRWVSVIRGVDPEALCDFHDEHGSQEYLKTWLDARDRHMKLLGAAEELERLNDSAGSGLVMGGGEFFDGIEAERREWKNTLTERAAQLRREAEK